MSPTQLYGTKHSTRADQHMKSHLKIPLTVTNREIIIGQHLAEVVLMSLKAERTQSFLAIFFKMGK